jgi:septal ring factor EnvC (AmiA/AmiB activator)
MKARLVFLMGLVSASAAALPLTAADTGGVAEADAALARISEVDKQLGELVRREKSLREELDASTKKARAARLRSVKRGRLYVRLTRAGLLPISGGFDDFVTHLGRMERLRSALQKDLATERHLTVRRRTLSEQLAQVTTKREALQAEHQSFGRAQQALLAARDRELAFERTFSSGYSHATVYGAGIGPADPSALSAGFANMKGRLPFPLPGRTEIHSARRSAGGPGLEMRAPRGSPVRAVYPGRVGFADAHGDYGRTVIIDHGEGHYTVSANLGEIDVHVGDDVSTGSRLGVVGQVEEGWLVYFEIRVGSETADPAEWFGI